MKTNITAEDMVNELQERIDFLQKLQEGLMFIYYGDPSLPVDLGVDSKEVDEIEKRPQRRSKPTTKKEKKIESVQRPADGISLKKRILSIMPVGTPLTAQEVFEHLNLAGWWTSSANPRGLVVTTLAQMTRDGLLQKAGDHQWLRAQPSAVAQATEEVISAAGAAEAA